MFQTFFILEGNNKNTYKIRSYKILQNKIAYLFDWAHKLMKSYINTKDMENIYQIS